MNTLTTNTQTLAAFEKSADVIVEIVEQLGFVTETPIAEGYLKKLIVATLQNNLLGNVNYSESENPVVTAWDEAHKMKTEKSQLHYPNYLKIPRNFNGGTDESTP